VASGVRAVAGQVVAAGVGAVCGAWAGSGSEDGTVSWTVIVPVKRLAVAKSRLRGAAFAPHAGHAARHGADEAHEALVLAMALDTIAAALTSPVVGRVVVVTPDAVTGEEATLLGAEIIPDVPDAGLNPALAYAAAHVRRTGPAGTEPGVAALAADLPALRGEELTAALRLAEASAQPLGRRALARSFVADSAGTGTVLLAAPSGAVLEPCFGPASAEAHAASGAVPLTGQWPSLRRDVDTPTDLAAAFVLGVGPRTAAAHAPSAARLAAEGG
jgi:2-phospho-L-lactate guanylyltransferase